MSETNGNSDCLTDGAIAAIASGVFVILAACAYGIFKRFRKRTFNGYVAPSGETSIVSLSNIIYLNNTRTNEDLQHAVEVGILGAPDSNKIDAIDTSAQIFHQNSNRCSDIDEQLPHAISIKKDNRNSSDES